jgi:catechol 2,3-dioxygenase-like lactoylglutathione lyase family enzyme
MTTSTDSGVHGVDHVAYVTYKPEETIHFYRDLLGFPLVHCILAPGWGNEPQPDFAHFFFDIGNGARMAFFYYFGEPPYDDPKASNLLKKARHLALLVDSEEELERYRQRLLDAGYPMRHEGKPVMHELIESIYMYDPNGYNLEISRKLRPLNEADAKDTELSIQALIDVAREPEPSLAKLWERKGELVLEQAKAMSRG